MTTGAEIVLEWFRKYSEQNGTPTPFEIRCQLELAIEHDKTELKKLRVADVVGRSEQLKALLEKLLNENMCSVVGDELIEEALKGF